MTRTILIHLHTEARDDDPRTADEIADAVGEALEFVLSGFERCAGAHRRDPR